MVWFCLLYNPGELSGAVGKSIQVLPTEDIVLGGHFHF